MNGKPIYADLFSLLEGLGFEVMSGQGEQAYFHRSTNTLLRFSSTDSRIPASNADLLSVQVRLLQVGLIEESKWRRLMRTR